MIEATGSTGWSELTTTDWSNLTTSGWSGLGVSAGEQARVTWSYDPTGQLLTEARSGANAYRTTYVYDPSGNRTVEITETDRTTSVYDGANRLLASNSFSGNTTYSYDPAGNRTRLETPALELTTYTWNAENQLTQIELPAGDVVTHVWSPVNKNAEERIVEQDDSVTVTRFLWDNNNVVRETDEVGAVEAEYTYQPEPFGDLVSQRRETDSSFYRFDALGSTTGLTDNTGAMTDDYRYRAFGELVETTGATENPYRWVGQVGYRSEEAIGLYNLRARDYDPAAGRFVSQDPLGLASKDSHFYRYVHNTPINSVDPVGLGPQFTFDDSVLLYLFRNFLQSNPSEADVYDYIQANARTPEQSELLWNYYGEYLQELNHPLGRPYLPQVLDDPLAGYYCYLENAAGFEVSRPQNPYELSWLVGIDQQILAEIEANSVMRCWNALTGFSLRTLLLRREETLLKARLYRHGEYTAPPDFHRESQAVACEDSEAVSDVINVVLLACEAGGAVVRVAVIASRAGRFARLAKGAAPIHECLLPPRSLSPFRSCGPVDCPLPPPKPGASASGAEGSVSAYRAQGGPGRPLLAVDENGNIALDRRQGRRRKGAAIHVGFDECRANQLVTENGREYVVEFEVKPSFLEKLRKTAEPEQVTNRSRLCPWKVDVEYPDQYAIPPALFDELEDAIIKGSGKIYIPGGK